MYTTNERVRQTMLRADALRRRGEKRLLNMLTALCGAISMALLGVFVAVNGAAQGGVQGLYGSMLMFDGAGGYVLVGVLSFGLAVVITVLCMRHKSKHEKNHKDTEEE